MQEKILGLVEMIPDAGCWIWTAATDKDGYGWVHKKLRTGKYKQLYAHRASYEAFKGPIPKGMLVCHTCDTPSCVNPHHLWIGTAKDNVHDQIKKGRKRHARTPKTCLWCKKEYQGIKIQKFCSEQCKEKDRATRRYPSSRHAQIHQQ